MARPSKFTSVAAQLKARIDAGTGVFAAGNLLPPEEELAAQFGVTRQTLRKAVATLVADGLVVRRPGCGTFVPFPAARGAQRDSLLYVGSTTEHYYQAFYEALCAEAERRGKAVTAFTPSGAADSLRRLRQLADSHRRLICMTEAWRKVRQALPAGLHVTLVSGSASADHVDRDQPPTYLISTDPYRAAKLAVEYLADLGHRRIGFASPGRAVGGDPMSGAVWPGYVPYLGYRSGLLERGLTETGGLAVPDQLMNNGDFAEGHYRYFARHLDDFDPSPTAYVVANDFRAGPLLRALRERGRRVPEEVSLVGIGNTPWAQAVDPPLTSVCLGETEMARLAVTLNAEPEPKTTRIVRVDPELVERHSAAAPSTPTDMTPPLSLARQ